MNDDEHFVIYERVIIMKLIKERIFLLFNFLSPKRRNFILNKDKKNIERKNGVD